MPDSEDIQPAVRNPPPGLGLGERLRSARKARALSVAQVAEALRLEEASVVALEDGHFDVMGAPVFVRGHLKRYARLVGLSQEAVLDAYRAAAPESDTPPVLARRRERVETERMGSWAYWLAAALLLVGIVIALGGGGDEEPAPAVAPPATSPGAVSEFSPVGPPAAEATGESAPGIAPADLPDTAALQQGAEAEEATP